MCMIRPMSHNSWREPIDIYLARTSLTQREVEIRGDIPRNSLSRWRTGRSGISLDSQRKLAKGFGISFEELRSTHAECERRRAGDEAPRAGRKAGGRYRDSLGELRERIYELDFDGLSEQEEAVMRRMREDILDQLRQMEPRMRLFLECYQRFVGPASQRNAS